MLILKDVQLNSDSRNTLMGWHFSIDEIRAALSGDKILNVSIDLSNPCNLNCPYCYIEEKNSRRKLRKPNELTFDETIQIIDDYAAAGAKTVNIVGAGEPTIDPHFEDVLVAISKRGMHTVIFTNGIRLAEDPELLIFLNKTPTTIVLKFNSFNPEIQDLVAGHPGYTTKRDLALDRLQDLGLNAYTPTRIGLDLMAFKGNLEELPRIHEMCRRHNYYPISADYIPTGRTQDGIFSGFASIEGLTPDNQKRISELLQPLSPSEKACIYQQTEEIDKSYGIERSGSSAYYGGGKCTQLLGLYVDIQGFIWPCVARSQIQDDQLKPTPLGHIRNGDIPSDIWRNHPYMRLIRSQYNGSCPYKPLISY